MKTAIYWTAALAVVAIIQVVIALRCSAEHVQGVVAAMTMVASLVFAWWFNRDPWWRTWFGRSLMLIAAALFLSSLATVMFRLFGEYPGRDILIVVSADAALAAMVIRTAVLRGAQRRDSDEFPGIERRH